MFTLRQLLERVVGRPQDGLRWEVQGDAIVVGTTRELTEMIVDIHDLRLLPADSADKLRATLQRFDHEGWSLAVFSGLVVVRTSLDGHNAVLETLLSIPEREG